MIDKNLKYLINKTGITPSQLARDLGVKLPIVHRLLSGENQNPTLMTLKLFAHYFKVSVGQLIGEINIFSEQTENNALETFDAHSFSKNAFTLIAPDSSMHPAIPKGATIIVDPNVKPSNRDFVVIEQEKTFLVRLFLNEGSNEVLLSSLNCFDTIVTELSKNCLIGTVVSIISSK